MTLRTMILITLISTAALLLAGCAAEEPPIQETAPTMSEPAPAATEAPAVTQQPAVSGEEAPVELPQITAEPSPTASPQPAATIEEEAAVESIEAEAVEEDETLDAEPTPTPPALPEGWYGPPDYPDGMNPLTGEYVEDPSMLERRPIAIKVSNYPALVRPQAGLNNADLVFEHYAEGGATRFTAVFYSKDAHTVGSVRSARIIDFEIPVMYDAAFGFSGAAGANKERFAEADWFDLIISPDFKDKGFYRAQAEDEDVDFWHLMFTSTDTLRGTLQDRGLDFAPDFQNGMIFSEEPPQGGAPAGQIEIGYSGSYVTWWYDSGVGRYYRWNDGERHDDANTDQQINTKNVILIAAEHVDTWIPETEVGQGAKSIEIQIWGEGPATIFRDGQRYDGRWQRANPKDMLTFSDLEGNPLPLGQGNSWFELVPLGFDKLYVTS